MSDTSDNLLRALRRSHYGSYPSRGGPVEIIAVPFLLVANKFFTPIDGTSLLLLF